MGSEQSASLGLAGQLQIYAFSWLFNFLMSLLGALIANGVYEVPLFQVVNVNLSIALFFAFVLAGLQVVLLMFLLASANFLAIPTLFFGVTLSLLLPFAPIAAYQIYAWFGGLPISGESFIYDDFLALFGGVMKSIASAFGQLSLESLPAGSKEKPVELLFGMKLETVSTLLTILATSLAILRFFIPKGSNQVVVYADRPQRTSHA